MNCTSGRHTGIAATHEACLLKYPSGIAAELLTPSMATITRTGRFLCAECQPIEVETRVYNPGEELCFLSFADPPPVQARKKR
jgi:hypothetical protein